MTTYPYLDPTLSSEARVEDLLPRMSIEQKAGLMFHTMLIAGPMDAPNPMFDLPTATEYLSMGLTHFNLLGSFDSARQYAEFLNQIQTIARAREWGMPVTVSSDPRHNFSENPGRGMAAGAFSQWPEHIGMAAIGDEQRMEEYADIVRQEYCAAGIRAALHPQADLATEYRWARISGGLGEDNEMAGRLCSAHIRGLQRGEKEYGKTSVSACVKHFPGGGPAKDGLDPHFQWGAEQVYPGDRFEYHLKPFREAVKSGVRCVMPSYGKPMGTDMEEVGMAFNRRIINDLLRKDLGFDGVVLSDWGLLVDMDESVVGDFAKARAWGVEHLSSEDRLVRALDSGVDQFGGEHCVDILLKLVNDGRVSEDRIDISARRLLKEKFDLGLFESPFVDVDLADTVIGRSDFVAAGLKAQKDSLTLLQNGSDGQPLLPLSRGTKVYLEGFNTVFPPSFGSVVSFPSEADVAIVRLHAPFEIFGKGKFAARFHHGSLEFSDATLDHIAELAKHCPVVLEIKAERPPVLGSLVASACAILLSYGVSEPALVDVLFGYSPKGKLPFDLPRSNLAVCESRTDTPFDTEDPVFRFGHGLEYKG